MHLRSVQCLEHEAVVFIAHYVGSQEIIGRLNLGRKNSIGGDNRGSVWSLPLQSFCALETLF